MIYQFSGMLGFIIAVGVFILCLPRLGKNTGFCYCGRRRQHDIAKMLAHIDFNHTWHPTPLNTPLIYKKTALGGFATFAYSGMAIIVFVFLLDWFTANQFQIIQAVITGTSKLTNPVPFTFNWTFISLDNLADCQRLCTTNFLPFGISGGRTTCTKIGTETSCQLTYRTNPKTKLPPAFSFRLMYGNAKAYAFHFNVSAVNWMGVNYGTNLTIEGEKDKVFTGLDNYPSSYTRLSVALLPFVWQGDVGLPSKPLATQGYLSSITLPYFLGQQNGASAWTDPALKSSGAYIELKFSVQNKVIIYTLSKVQTMIVFVANVACLIGSSIFYLVFNAIYLVQVINKNQNDARKAALMEKSKAAGLNESMFARPGKQFELSQKDPIAEKLKKEVEEKAIEDAKVYQNAILHSYLTAT